MDGALSSDILNLMRYPETTRPPLPDWMKVRLKMGSTAVPQEGVRGILSEKRLPTVCEEASCPNLGHCWSQGTATFLIMGDRCTRRCGFCDIRTAKPLPLSEDEPDRVADAIQAMKLRHAVITSVDRDDLADTGSRHFGEVIRRTREKNPNTTIEVLIPDFKGRPEFLAEIWTAQPDIINHNVETVPSLFKSICPQSSYDVSIAVLRMCSEKGFLTKSGIILGLGERMEEVKSVLTDLATAGVKLATIGQYLPPTRQHAPLAEYVDPAVFAELKDFALGLGFLYVESGPLVRSSYHAGEALERVLAQKKVHDQRDSDVV